MKISICVPIHEYNGFGSEVLEFSFKKIESQIFKNFDVVISDNSDNNIIENLCKQWKNRLDIRYFRNNGNKNSGASNTNNAIRNATGEIVKILCGDDFLLGNNSLDIVANNFDNDTNFLATGYIHTIDRINYFNYHFPQINPNIDIVNTIGTPSCVTIRRFDNMPEFDENLYYCYDCCFYYEYIKKYGGEKFITNSTIGNYLWNNSITSKLVTQELIDKENEYILRKHGFAT